MKLINPSGNGSLCSERNNGTTRNISILRGAEKLAGQDIFSIWVCADDGSDSK